jgi:integrase
VVEVGLPIIGYDAERKRYVVRWRDPAAAGPKRPEHIKRFARKDLAQRFLREVEEDLALGRPWEPRVARRAPDLNAASAAYLTERARRLAPSTLMRHANALTMFQRSLGDAGVAETTVGHLTRESLGAFHDWLLRSDTSRWGEGERKPETVRKVVGIIEGFWKWLADHDGYGEHVGRPRSLELQAAPAMEGLAPTWVEADACIEACDDVLVRRALVIMRFTGLRIAQVRALDVTDLDMTGGLLTVRTGKSAQEKIGRVVPVSRHLITFVRAWAPSSGKLIADTRVRQALERHAIAAWKESGVREVVWMGRPHHAFRKCFATGIVAAGATEEQRKALMGHARGLSGVYVGLDALRLRAAVDLIPPLTAPVVIDLASRKAIG